MLNKKPIFITGVARGGSSILLNLLRSHPDVCSPRGETQEVFLGKRNESIATRLRKRADYLSAIAVQREHVFSMRSFRERRPLTRLAKRIVDRLLFQDKLRAVGITQNYYKTEDERYTISEIRASRLLCKNLNALVYTTDLFADMYPDATFFGVVRNGFAVCESHVRRGSTPRQAGKLYAGACKKMIADAQTYANYHIIKYDLLASDVLAAIDMLFEHANLDRDRVNKFRLVVGEGGRERGHTGGDANELVWYSPEDLRKLITSRFDDNQIGLLSEEAKAEFLAEAEAVMSHFGYL